MIWHYSFNEELVRTDGKPLNKWSPSPNEPHIPIGKTYWFLRLTTFDDFLKRRSALSHNPKKHFPSVETYYKNNNDCKAAFCKKKMYAFGVNLQNAEITVNYDYNEKKRLVDYYADVWTPSGYPFCYEPETYKIIGKEDI